MTKKTLAVALFSGGLDSLLAAKLLREQGIEVLCLHFYSPFFGSPKRVKHWRATYGLNVVAKDVGEEFCAMLAAGPSRGFGKNLNPCVDCKILQYREAKKVMDEIGADFLASGEVLGQRPMSQRKDALNAIHNEAGVAGLALRPLSALLLEPSEPEIKGLVDRSRLMGISGRSRVAQFELALKYGISEIPSPAGGCQLTESERARRYWQPLKKYLLNGTKGAPAVADYAFAALGRQFWNEDNLWLAVGRNRRDNEALLAGAREDDVILRLKNLAGPVGLAREGLSWPEEALAQAAAIVASYCPEVGESVRVNAYANERARELNVAPKRDWENWGLPAIERVKEEMAALRPLWYKNR